MKQLFTFWQKRLKVISVFMAYFLSVQGIALAQVIPGTLITTAEGVQGVVFSVKNNGTEVSMVDLNDLASGTNISWMSATPAVEPDGRHTYDNEVSARTDTDGFMNSAMIRNALATNAGLTSDLWNAVTNDQKNNGWYIPSYGQLYEIYIHRTEINNTLTANSGSTISTGEYWSSTLRGNSRVWKIDMSSVTGTAVNRTLQNKVRGCYDAYLDGGVWHLRHTNCTYPIIVENDTPTACDSLPWIDGEIYRSDVIAAELVKWPIRDNLNTHCIIVKQLILDLGHSSHGHPQITACDSYPWHGHTYTTSVTNEPSLTINDDGCNHYDTLDLTIHHMSTATVTIDTCNNYTWTTSNYNGSNTTIQNFTNSTTTSIVKKNHTGCDSVMTLNLTIRQSENPTTNIPFACDSYQWRPGHGIDTTYTTPGTYSKNYIADNGCLSQATLNLTLYQSTHAVTTQEICNGDTYTWNRTDGTNQDYTVSSTATGYQWNYTNSDGCLSTDTLHLTVWPIITTTLQRQECQNYTWNVYDGVGGLHPQGTYYASGTYNATVTSSHGCDSNITLQLTINQPDADQIFTEDECNSYTWPLGVGDGQTYTSSVSGASHTYTNMYGCQSTNILNLTIRHSTYRSITAVACNTKIGRAHV